MEDKQLRDLQDQASCLLGLLEVSTASSAIAYDTSYGWRVRVAPKHDVRIHINIDDSTRCLSAEDRIHIVFSPFEDEIEIRDFILPLLETETYRERQDLCCGERAPGEAPHFENENSIWHRRR